MNGRLFWDLDEKCIARYKLIHEQSLKALWRELLALLIISNPEEPNGT
jgi:hypothetical protein